jgi:hypothetical protein
MTTSAVRFSEHAIDRMLEWGLDVDDVEAALAEGETIEDYADGSRLVLGRAGVRPVHVVVADEEPGGVCTVVTCTSLTRRDGIRRFVSGDHDEMRAVPQR